MSYNKTEQTFERVAGTDIESYLLFDREVENCKTLLCESSYKALITDNAYFAIPDVDKYDALTHGEAQYGTLNNQGIKSAILAPIANNEELLGVLEVVSTKAYELNSINANLLNDVMPFIVSSVLRSKEEEENLIEAIIQQECTAIHPSVHWKFEEEARIFIDNKQSEVQTVAFGEITFNDVYPYLDKLMLKGPLLPEMKPPVRI